MDDEALYVQLGRLISEIPDFEKLPYPLPADAQMWLGRANALVEELRDMQDAVDVKKMTALLAANLVNPAAKRDWVNKLMPILFRALARAELRAPVAAQGAFIPAGNSFDALAAFSRVFAGVTTDLLIVDPYMDEKTLSDYAVLAPETVPIRLLSDQQYHKPSLGPAVKAWIAQYAAKRPLVARLTSPRLLHDRLLIKDNSDAYVFTQSLKDFATRSPASIVRADAEIAALKITAYKDIWDAAADVA